MSNSKTHRTITGAFGVFLIGLAILTLVAAEASTRVGAGIVALILGILGLDALIGSLRGRRSLVSRIGPLP